MFVKRVDACLRFFARGVPIIYYGTEQGLAGHQANVLDRAALEKVGPSSGTSSLKVFLYNHDMKLTIIRLFRQAGKENKGQAFVRESLWQSRSPAWKD